MPFRKNEEKARLREDILAMMRDGKRDVEIMEALNVETREFNVLKTEILKEREIDAKKPPVETFAEYQLRQFKNIDQLENVIENARADHKWQNEITAIKAKADILDKIIAKGQELGVYHKQGNKISVNGVMSLVHMNATELALHLDQHIVRIQNLSDELGRPLAIDEKKKHEDELLLNKKLPSGEPLKLPEKTEEPPQVELVSEEELEAMRARTENLKRQMEPKIVRKKKKITEDRALTLEKRLKKKPALQCPECKRKWKNERSLMMHLTSGHKYTYQEAKEIVKEAEELLFGMKK